MPYQDPEALLLQQLRDAELRLARANSVIDSLNIDLQQQGEVIEILQDKKEELEGRLELTEDYRYIGLSCFCYGLAIGLIAGITIFAIHF